MTKEPLKRAQLPEGKQWWLGLKPGELPEHIIITLLMDVSPNYFRKELEELLLLSGQLLRGVGDGRAPVVGQLRADDYGGILLLFGQEVADTASPYSTALLEKGEHFRERSPQHSVSTKGLAPCASQPEGPFSLKTALGVGWM